MNLQQLDTLFAQVASKHPVRAFVVIGSLSVLALIGKRPIPDAMTVSVEVDAYPESDPDRAFEIADDFGLGSEFEQEHGYYYDAVSPSLPTLPRGWQQRLIDHALPSGTLLRFIEPHDAAISKYSRGEAKDLQWIRAGIDAGILSVPTLEYRCRETVFDSAAEAERVRAAIDHEAAKLGLDQTARAGKTRARK